MRKLMSFILTLSLLICSLTTTVISADPLPFHDVKESAWYYDEVKTVYEAGIMKGKTSTGFDSTANMSRAEFVTVLARLSGDSYTGKGESLTFADTDKNAWYADYVAWGVETEMVKGLPGNKFAPNQAVSRQEMAVFIDRFISYMNLELSDNSQIDAFSDVDKIADYATDAVDTMRKSGIITGNDNGNFNPTNNASRAEVATVITRILPMIKDGVEIVPPIIDRENFDVQEAFMYSNENENVAFPYRIYIPESYSAEKEYPLVIYLHSRDVTGTDNVRHLNDVGILFDNPDSLIYDSIVLVPQAPTYWKESMVPKLAELLEYINSQYSIDSGRQYIIGAGSGSWPAWKLVCKYPNEVSAVLLIHGTGPTWYRDGDGVVFALIDDIPDDAKDIPIHFLHDIDDGVKFTWRLGPDYGRDASKWLIELGGFTNIVLTETSGHGANVYKHFVSKRDDTLLEWLFAQHRETK